MVAGMQTHSQPTTPQPSAGESPPPAIPGTSLLEELLTAGQVADLLKMRLSTVEEYARRGVLPSMKLGRHRRFIRSEIERAILAIAEGPRATQRQHSSPAPAWARETRSRRTR